LVRTTSKVGLHYLELLGPETVPRGLSSPGRRALQRAFGVLGRLLFDGACVVKA
jgi:hypothetical protein